MPETVDDFINKLASTSSDLGLDYWSPLEAPSLSQEHSSRLAKAWHNFTGADLARGKPAKHSLLPIFAMSGQDQAYLEECVKATEACVATVRAHSSWLGGLR